MTIVGTEKIIIITACPVCIDFQKHEFNVCEGWWYGPVYKKHCSHCNSKRVVVRLMADGESMYKRKEI